MGDVDVLYRVPTDSICWRYINQHVGRGSVDLAIYKASLDSYSNKKTIWNAIGRLTPNGIFCIQCQTENISDIIRTVKEAGYNYRTVYYQLVHVPGAPVLVYLVAYRGKLFEPKLKPMTRVDTIETIVYTLVQLTDFGSLIMTVGSDTVHFAPIAKNLGRYVISFGDNDYFSQVALDQGMKEVRFDG
jgi:hypothetical protein